MYRKNERGNFDSTNFDSTNFNTIKMNKPTILIQEKANS